MVPKNMKRILIINGHPDKQSLCFELAQSYKKGADTAGAQCKLVNLIDLNFNPILGNGYRQRTELEPDLLMIQQEITEADHLVLVYPTWWATYPALLKGFIDRVFLPGYAFKYRENSPFWDKLLVGKTARLIVTMDSPKWYFALFMKNAGHRSMKSGILEFCGIKPVKITSFSPIKSSNASKRLAWVKSVEKLGEALK
jgi:putative NADPH-quinone reductase